jgi:hypothetical protein
VVLETRLVHLHRKEIMLVRLLTMAVQAAVVRVQWAATQPLQAVVMVALVRHPQFREHL